MTTNETTVYRINPTGYYGNDSIVASALDSVVAGVRESIDRIVYIWANNDSGSYKLFWTLDDVLLTTDGLEFFPDELQENPFPFIEEIRMSVAQFKDTPTI